MLEKMGCKIKGMISRRGKRIENSGAIYFISFPKSGRTWVRLMLGKVFERYLGLEELDIDTLINIEMPGDKIPNIRFIHDDDVFWKKPHELNTSKLEYKDCKIIFLVRDPRDILVSSYFQKTKRNFDTLGQTNPFTGELSDYLYEEVGNFDTILRFYTIWETNRHIPKDFLLVRYEDIHQNAYKELRRILKFIGLPEVNNEIVMEAVKWASFDRMHKLEITNPTKRNYRLKPANIDDRESYKTRRGKVGGFYDYLTEDEIEYLNHKMRNSLSDFFGYNNRNSAQPGDQSIAIFKKNSLCREARSE